MTEDEVNKHRIKDALAQFVSGNLADNARKLLDALGYRSEKRAALKPNTAENFIATYDRGGKVKAEAALLSEWASVDLLFQLTDDEIKQANQGRFDSTTKVDNKLFRSYLFFAVQLRGERYTRTQLANITREINKLFAMPVMVFFRTDRFLTLAIINRRLSLKDETKDVLEKVTLIKDIRCANPHRAHIEILFDLSLPQLIEQHGCTNFVELHAAWQKTLDTSELNKRFFKEVANWYFWALTKVTFPKDAVADRDVRNALGLIRLITRLIFVWFIKEKGLVPDALFIKHKVDELIKYDDPRQSTYYKAILQNLFFATLNQEMNVPGKINRKFRNLAGKTGSLNQNFMIHTLYRYEAYFKDPKAAIELFSTIPFLNGGLFECLDKYEGAKTTRVDGFSDRPDNDLVVPDELFFHPQEMRFDLNEVYGTAGKLYKVRGLIDIFESYKFTIDENTPIEEEIALDPELLGKVFENLLATYNPETGVTARKQLGGFYTPREIVNYMVDESLIAYFMSKLSPRGAEGPAGLEGRLRHLLSYTEERHQFSDKEVDQLIAAIDTLKAIDPACGSGAFPMGLLHKLVLVLAKLDPHNTRWKDRQIAKANEIEDADVRERTIADIEEAFERNELNYGRKLYLIENCIFGVDIQPVAVQIAKLRCFISLVVDQCVDDTQPNRGIRPLPNLETKFVAANTLIGIERPLQMGFRNPAIDEKETEVAEVRHRYMTARTPQTKQKYRDLDAKLRAELGQLLKADGWSGGTAKQLAQWNPYDQNTAADFFDPEWMFGITDGFDVAVGNPPYISALEFTNIYGTLLRDRLNAIYESAKGAYDIFVLFIERGLKLLSIQGTLAYITPNKYLSARYAVALRDYILREGCLGHLVDLSAIRVFEEAAVYPVVSFINKNAQNRQFVRVLLPAHGQIERFDPAEFAEHRVASDMLRLLPENIWGFLLSTNVALLSRVLVGTEPLERFGDINATSTAGEADEYGTYITDRHAADSLRVVNTGTIDRYVSLWSIRQMTHAGNKFLTPYLPLGKADVSDRRREMYSSPKVIFAKMASRCEAFIDLKGEYASLNTNCFYNPKPSISLQFVGAFCNSQMFMFLYNQYFGALRMSGGYYQFQAPQLRVIPLKRVNTVQQAPIVKLVDKILAAKRTDLDADTSALERKIDELVYRLYGLTAEEIKIVEGVNE